MTRMTGPDCVVMCNLINTHTHILCDHHILQTVDQPGKIMNFARGQLNREKDVGFGIIRVYVY